MSKTGYSPIVTSGLTQADGEQVIFLPNILGERAYTNHTILVTPHGSPTAGTLSVAVQMLGSDEYTTLDTKISMLTPTAYLLEAPAVKLKVTPTGFNGSSYDVVVVGW